MLFSAVMHALVECNFCALSAAQLCNQGTLTKKMTLACPAALMLRPAHGVLEDQLPIGGCR